jgi:hypothetical protein
MRAAAGAGSWICRSTKINTAAGQRRIGMTLDEAIKRELDIVKRSERKAAEQFPEPYSIAHKTCMQCAEDHRQLAEWLTELKERRKKDA